MTVDQLINYFHPRYIEGKIKTHHDLKKYLIKLNSDNGEKINEIESVLKDAYKEMEQILEKNNDLQKYNESLTGILDRSYYEDGGYDRDAAIADGWGMIHSLSYIVANEARDSFLAQHDELIEALINLNYGHDWKLLPDHLLEQFKNVNEKYAKYRNNNS